MATRIIILCRLLKYGKLLFGKFRPVRAFKYELSHAPIAAASSTYYQSHIKDRNGITLMKLLSICGVALFLSSVADHQANCERSDDDDDFSSRTNDRKMLSRNFVADVVEVCAPAVVNIVCISATSYGQMAASTGSGFIVTKDGYIVTNAHVVAGSVDGKVIITMKDGRKKPGMMHSLDLTSDLAIVKIDAMYVDEALPIIPYGVSSRVRAGEFVIAIGSPMLLQNSASLGIVSATARHASELGISNNRSEYIQTDAAINMGNSGGPLVNLDGEVIGINTMKVKGVDGISFAIPIDIASQIIKQLLQHKRVIRPFVGLKMANVVSSQQEAEKSRSFLRSGGRSRVPALLTTEGMLVTVIDVVKGSPAQMSGLQSGDVITEINGKPVTSVRDVLDEIGLEVGRRIEFTVKRNGNTAKFVLHTAPENS